MQFDRCVHFNRAHYGRVDCNLLGNELDVDAEEARVRGKLTLNSKQMRTVGRTD